MEKTINADRKILQENHFFLSRFSLLDNLGGQQTIDNRKFNKNH